MPVCYIVSAERSLFSFGSFIVTSEFDFLEFDLKLGMRMGSFPETGICIWEILSMES